MQGKCFVGYQIHTFSMYKEQMLFIEQMLGAEVQRTTLAVDRHLLPVTPPARTEEHRHRKN